MNSFWLFLSKNAWIFLVILYGIIKGMREGVKKQAHKKSSVPEVLFFYTFFRIDFRVADITRCI